MLRNNEVGMSIRFKMIATVSYILSTRALVSCFSKARSGGIEKLCNCLHAHYSHNPQNGNNMPLHEVPYSEDLTKNIGGYHRPVINWYPGHIAKAESQLAETLKVVDIVLEVRDARAPKATAHPKVAEWSGGKPRIVVLTKLDMIPSKNVGLWRRWGFAHGALTFGEQDIDLQTKNRALQALKEREKYVKTLNSTTPKNKLSKTEDIANKVEDILFVDAKRGKGIHALHRAIWKAGQHVNERRARRGLSGRALRVGVIGYPNVGKSALINRILGRKRARSSNTPGVTRSLQWIRVRSTSDNSKKKEFELLDSPGIIPANMFHLQSDAMLLAACNSIGNGAYDNQAVASFFLEWIKTLYSMEKQELCCPQFLEKCIERYGFDPSEPVTVDSEGIIHTGSNATNKIVRLLTGEEMLYKVADNKCRGSPEDAARKILQDFRTGRLGPISLQFAPNDGYDDGVEKNMVRGIVDRTHGSNTEDYQKNLNSYHQAKAAIDLAMDKGLELPPSITQEENSKDVGKGFFDGW